MTSSLLAWSVVALLVFWAVGAYNRLIRLRAEVNASFLEIQDQLRQQAQLVTSILPATPLDPDAAEPLFLAQIHDASDQLVACLDAVRPRPLDHERVAAMASAAGVLAGAWERAEREDAHDLAGSQLPETLIETRARLVRQTEAAVAQFDDAVARYNAAIAQFPALVLASLFGFKPGRSF
jgi:LemA protein